LIYNDVRGEVTYDPHAGEDVFAQYFCDGYEYQIEFAHELHCVPFLSGFGIVFAYDILSKESWEEVVRLHDTVSHELGDKISLVQVLVLGLKADLDGQGKRVPRVKAEAFARAYGYRYTECSARTGKGAYDALGSFVEHVHSTSIRYRGDLQGWKSSKDQSRLAFSKAVEAVRSRRTGLATTDNDGGHPNTQQPREP
jgi:hypothetical protein